MAADTARTLDDTAGGSAAIAEAFNRQKQAYAGDPSPSYQVRIARLNALLAALEQNEQKIVEAINEDFGARSDVETLLAEVTVSIGAIRHAKRHLKRWMRPRSVKTPLHMAPGRSRLEPQPLGVIGIISPWNYPIQLAFSPAAAALAAGNRVMIKPSELTPHTSTLMREMMRAAFSEDVLSVIVGGVEAGKAFAEVPFDHLLFTGSTAVGRLVAEAAAKNLTPVTLELGGKSPVIIDDSADLPSTALSIAQGKMLNSGQTCIAPDYVLVANGKVGATVDAIAGAARKLYPQIDTTPDYTAVISDRHFARLESMVEEAREAGAEITEVGSSNALRPQRKLPLTIVANPPSSLRLMQEEIFGPILPVIGAPSSQAAIEFVNKGDRPLALYWFGKDSHARDRVLQKTVSGGVTVNDTLWHCAQENLPFGGVGKSGMGAYHGDKGFETFSHMKPVFYQSRFSSGGMMHPPYTEKTRKTLNFFKKII